MQLDNIRVSRKLWFAFLGLMVAMALVSGIAQNRGNTTMARAMDAVVDIDTRVVAAVRWRGGTETAVNMIMGGAVTTDAVLAQQYDARVKEIIGNINKIQETIVAGATAPEEKAAIDKVVAERKLVLQAVAKTWELFHAAQHTVGDHMQLDNIRVSRKLWFAFLGLMVAMALVSGIAQNRGNTTMARAMDAVVDIDTRVVAAVRWRGGTETAVNMIMGGAVTTDAVLAQQYDARVKEIVGDINKIQETIVAGATAPEEKATIDKVVAERKLVLEAVAKTWELKGAGDAVETQRFADEQLTPMVARYLKAQDEFIA